jgi:hypothetical protein
MVLDKLGQVKSKASPPPAPPKPPAFADNSIFNQPGIVGGLAQNIVASEAAAPLLDFRGIPT